MLYSVTSWLRGSHLCSHLLFCYHISIRFYCYQQQRGDVCTFHVCIFLIVINSFASIDKTQTHTTGYISGKHSCAAIVIFTITTSAAVIKLKSFHYHEFTRQSYLAGIRRFFRSIGLFLRRTYFMRHHHRYTLGPAVFQTGRTGIVSLRQKSNERQQQYRLPQFTFQYYLDSLRWFVYRDYACGNGFTIIYHHHWYTLGKAAFQTGGNIIDAIWEKSGE